MVEGVDVKDVLMETEIDYLSLIPSHIDLVGAEVEMVNLNSREEKMKEALAPVADDFDFIIIDCSPSLGLITINALTAADSVIVPVQCEYSELEGLGKLLNTIKIIQTNITKYLENTNQKVNIIGQYDGYDGAYHLGYPEYFFLIFTDNENNVIYKTKILDFELNNEYAMEEDILKITWNENSKIYKIN